MRSITFNIIFAGTPNFAGEALEFLIAAGHTISLVLTKPDSVSGRGNSVQPSYVKKVALKHGLRVLQPQSFKNNPDIVNELAAANADYMIVAAYGLILPQHVLDIPKYGCVNIHASLLPKWRGAAPIQRSILAGDKETGITLIQMNSGLDTGDMLVKKEVIIEETDNTSSLHDKLMTCGANLIVEYLSNPAGYVPVAQPIEQVSYANKITKAEAEINWSESATDVCRKIRAYNPQPGAFTELDGVLLRIWKASAISIDSTEALTPGTIVNTHKKMIVSAGFGTYLKVEELQLSGSKRMDAASFLAGRPNLVHKLLKVEPHNV